MNDPAPGPRQRLLRRLMSVPIFWKVLGIGVLVALLFGSVTLWQTRTMTSRILERNLEKRTLELSRSLAVQLERPLLTDNLLAIHWQLNRYLKMFPEIRYILVRNFEGRVVDHTFHQGVPASLLQAYPHSVGSDGIMREFDSPEGLLFDAVYPILDNQAGQVEVALTNRSVVSELSVLSRSVLWTLLLCAVLGTGLAWGLTEILTRPIHLLDRAVQTVGEGEFSTQAEVFHEDEVGRLAVTFNQMTANLRKYREKIQEKEKNRLFLLDKIVKAQEEERGNLSRELHDRMGQSLSAILLSLKTGCRYGTQPHNGCVPLEGKLRDMIEEVRRLAWNMRPSILDDFGLNSALARYAEEMSRQSGMPIDYQYVGPPDLPRLPGQIETTVYRITQEAVVNVVRHSSASRASIVMIRNREVMTLLVEDNGRGFNADAVVQHGLQSLGLTGMKERAGLVGGTCIVESTMGEGTTVRVQVPLGEEVVPCLSAS
jgi:signal transduction histidine kinase